MRSVIYIYFSILTGLILFGLFKFTSMGTTADTYPNQKTPAESISPTSTPSETLLIEKRDAPSNTPKDCGKSTFFLYPGPPFDETSNIKAREYIKQNNLKIIYEQESQILVETNDINSIPIWIEKVKKAGIGNADYDTYGCDFINP